MATVGHIAAGIAIARAGNPVAEPMAALIVTAAAVAPDVDLLLGIDHRGPTHSLAFALVLGILAFIVARTIRISQPARLGLLAFAAVVSHLVLDLLTVRSQLTLLWPISRRGFDLPFQPLPSIPLDDRLLSVGGVLLVFGEIAWASALIYLGVSIRRRGTDPARGGAPPAA